VLEAGFNPVAESFGLEDHPHPITGGRRTTVISEACRHRGARHGDGVDHQFLLDPGAPLVVFAVAIGSISALLRLRRRWSRGAHDRLMGLSRF